MTEAIFSRKNYQSKHQARVEQFMAAAGQKVPQTPTHIDAATRKLRAKLIFEEAMELIQHGLGIDILIRGGRFHDGDNYIPSMDSLEFVVNRDFDMVETVDGCADLSVVNTGTLSAMGVMDEPILKEIDTNNLAKFGPGAYKRPDGKWVKPPNHPKPDIEGHLNVQCQLPNQQEQSACVAKKG